MMKNASALEVGWRPWKAMWVLGAVWAGMWLVGRTDAQEKAAPGHTGTSEAVAEKAASDAEHSAPAAGAHAEAADAHAEHAAGDHGGGHGAHHDPTDLSHANAGPQLEDPSQWKSDLAIGTLLVFLGLLILLTKFAWRPIMDGLEKREAAIAANIEEAQRSADKAAAQLRQYEAKLAAAAEEARNIVGQARKDADAARERILAEAQEAAQKERQRAIEDITGAKNQALQEMTQKSVDLAVVLAGRMVRRQLTQQDHAELIREVLDQFPSRN
ncbi:MAG: F0F1 ATP synthase subunit B [Pirellulaceae bacterium]